MRVVVMLLACAMLLQSAYAAEPAPAAESSTEQGLFVVEMHLAGGAPDTPEEHAALAEHVNYLGSLYDQGVLYLAGPFMDDSEAGLLVLQADSLEAARSFAANDPTVRGGLMVVDAVHPWWVPFSRPEDRSMTRGEFDEMMAAGEEAGSAE